MMSNRRGHKSVWPTVLATGLLVAALLNAAARPSAGGDSAPAAAQQATATAEQPAKAPEAVDAGKASLLVSQLADASYEVREKAEAGLKSMGPGVLAAIDPILARTEDAEVVWRLERVYRALVPLSEYQGATPQPGFLGISYAVVDAEGQPQLGERQWGVVVQSVVPDTPAEKAGLQVGDVVVALDGERFVGEASTQFFSERLSRIGEGAEVTISYLRGGEQHEVTLTLASRQGRDLSAFGVQQPLRIFRVPNEEGADGEVVVPDRNPPGAAGSALPPDQRVLDYRWGKYWRSHLKRVQAAATVESGETEAGPSSGASPVGKSAQEPKAQESK